MKTNAYERAHDYRHSSCSRWNGRLVRRTCAPPLSFGAARSAAVCEICFRFDCQPPLDAPPRHPTPTLPFSLWSPTGSTVDSRAACPESRTGSSCKASVLAARFSPTYDKRFSFFPPGCFYHSMQDCVHAAIHELLTSVPHDHRVFARAALKMGAARVQVSRFAAWPKPKLIRSWPNKLYVCEQPMSTTLAPQGQHG